MNERLKRLFDHQVGEDSPELEEMYEIIKENNERLRPMNDSIKAQIDTSKYSNVIGVHARGEDFV